MGIASSHPDHHSEEQIYHELTRRFVSKFTAIDLATIRDTFDKLATPTGPELVWTEETFVKFLELPDLVGSSFFLSASYIASLPYTDNSPMILTYESMIRVIAIFTGRIEGLLKRSGRDNLVFNSFAVFERNSASDEKRSQKDDPEILDAIDLFHYSESRVSTDRMRITKKELKKLIKFLLAIQQMGEYEVIAHYIDRFSEENMSALDEISEAIVRTISSNEKITRAEFTDFLQTSPGLLAPLTAIFNRFLFPGKGEPSQRPARMEDALVNSNMLAQLSLFLPRDLVFGKVDRLYTASHDGFAMGAFEVKTLKYSGPTILLLNGTLKNGDRAVFGIYNQTPWKQNSKECFGDSATRMIQCLPYHRLFKAPELRRLSYFSKHFGIGVGCLPPTEKSHDPGTLSLVVDSSLEYAIFRHYTSPPERISITEVEVWGLGGDREAQRKAWLWEENEAQRRREVNIHDLENDRNLLEMAGLIRQNRSGGSI